MLENFPVYLELHTESIYPIFPKYMLKKTPFYSAEIVRYALQFRYTPIQS